MELVDDVGPGPVALDTAVFIYFIQEEPRYLPHILPLFEQADAGVRELVTSAVTLLEVLVVPYRSDDLPLAERYEQLLTRSQGMHLIDITREHLRAAAQLRALGRVKTPDALQLAAAVSAGCRMFITNDRELPEVADLRIIQLSTYLET